MAEARVGDLGIENGGARIAATGPPSHGGEGGGGAGQTAKLQEPLEELRARLAAAQQVPSAPTPPVCPTDALTAGGSAAASLSAAAAGIASAAAAAAAAAAAPRTAMPPQPPPPEHTAAAPAPPAAATAPALPQPVAHPPSDEHWVSVHDAAGLWQLAVQGAQSKPPSTKPSAQPAPPGVFDVAPAVITLAAHDEAATAAAAISHFRAAARNEQLMRACWPCRQSRLAAAALGASRPPPDPWVRLAGGAQQRRLVVLCGATFESMREHDLLLEHASVLIFVAALSDEACASRGESDTYAPLWRAMETGAPLVVLEAPTEASQASSNTSNKQSFATRRTRKQLLHRLSKQPVAAQYAWEALTVVADQGPTVEEGWAKILTV